MNLEDDYDKRRGAGTSTETAYTVEARINYSHPVSISGQIFDLRWKRVLFAESAASLGIPAAPPYKKATLDSHMLAYASAQALRWWLHATAYSSGDLGAWALETRLVSHKITTSHEIEAIEAHDVVLCSDRSNILPGGNEVA